MGVVRSASQVRRLKTARAAFRRGFTMIELIMVMVLIGILAAVGASRFFDQNTYEARAYADQVKSLVRYAQKLAIAQNRRVHLRSTPNGFAVCFDAGAACAGAADRAQAPGGANNGSTETRNFCRPAGGAYVANWACVGKPNAVAISTTPLRAEFGATGAFYFDRMGRPFNSGDAPGSASTFTQPVLTVASGNQAYTVTVVQDTGYVF